MTQATMYALGKQTLLLMRFLGYSFVLFFLIDSASLLIPLKFTNSLWEFETIGQIIERLPVVLMAPVLIFAGEEAHRFRWEFILLKVLNWAIFLFAILTFLSAPLFIVNSFRVQEIRHSEIIARSTQQNEPLRQLNERLNAAKTDDEIRNVLRSLPVPGNQRPNLNNPQEQKTRILEQIDKNQEQIKERVETDKTSQSRAIWRNGLKWATVALIAGGLLAYFWQVTRWARLPILIESDRKQYEEAVIGQPSLLNVNADNQSIDYGADAPPDLPQEGFIKFRQQEEIDYGADVPTDLSQDEFIKFRSQEEIDYGANAPIEENLPLKPLDPNPKD
jgi:hypothetical protein